MVKRKRNNNGNNKQTIEIDEEEEVEKLDADDYCFVCKDGGLLMVCDHKDCGKPYHPECVGKKETDEETEDQWICGWHHCLVCQKNSRYQCFCCPNAVCQSCYKDAAFAKLRGNKGFCNDCLKLALLGEEGVDFDSDGEKVDFKDRETYEGLFKEYWDLIKVKEGLTLEDLHSADIELKKDENYKRSRKSKKSRQEHYDSDESVKEVENIELLSDDYESDDDVQPETVINKVNKVNNKEKPKRLPKRRKGAKKIEFVGWASKSLIQFLASIGEDTSKKLSQDNVALIISKYVHDNKLLHPDKKKTVLCDVRLRSLLKRKTISVYKINDALEAHFFDNLDKSEDEGYSSGCEVENASLPEKKQPWWRKVGSFQHKGSLLEKFQKKEPILEEPNKTDVAVKVIYSQYATIVPQNMKLVYLKKCLIEKLLEQHETFESKVVGSFVKVKSDPFDARHPYQLLPVTGILNLGAENNRKVLLQVSNLPNDVPIRLLSNDEISEDDCLDLRKKVDAGLLQKPTVVKLQKKAKDLHEDITKHWITRELSTLRNRIDLANEKGRRAELFEYHRRRDLLQSEAEQLRLLNDVPKVIADAIEVKCGSEETEQNDSSEKISNSGKASEGNGKVPA